MTTTYAGRPSFDIGRVIERTFAAFGHNLIPFTIISAIFVGVPQLILTFARLMLVGGGGTQISATSTVLTIVGSIIGLIGGLIAQAGVMQGTIADLSNEKVSLGAMMRTGLRFAAPLFAIGLVTGIAVWLGLLALIVPGLFLAVMFSVAGPAEVIERKGVFASMSRSAELTKGHRWMTFFLFVIFWILVVASYSAFVIMLGVAIVAISAVVGAGPAGAGAGSAGGMVADAVLAAVLSTVLGLVSSVGGAVLGAAVYFELRSLKEGIAPQSLLSVFD